MKKITLFIVMVFAVLNLTAQRNKTIRKQSIKQKKIIENLAIRKLEEAHNIKTTVQIKEYYKKLKEKHIKQKGNAKETHSCSTQDSLALVAIYNNMNGTNWTHQENWLSNTPVKDWWGITVENNRVTCIDFFWDWDSTQNVAGKFVDEFLDLTALEVIDFTLNKINDSLHPGFFDLQNLKYLDISVNQLQGPIPKEINNSSSLEYISLNANQLSGSLPTELDNLTNLQTFACGLNQITGTIPTELQDLTNLHVLNLNNNNLKGSIPSELGNLPKLNWVNMSNNQLTGNIPPELGNLTDMQELSLYSNQLTGPIPPELGNLEKLVVLDLYSNNFTDSIPKELGNLTNLELLDIGRNNLTGHIPPTLGDLNNLEFLDLYYNQLTGSIPSKLGNLIKMETLYLGFNQLTGTIPAELGNLTNLEMLYLSYNQLTGTIPVEFGNLTSLKWCYFNNNQLEGAIPSEIGSIYSMQQLDIYNNNLDGLPDFSNLSEMTIFRIQNNYFSFGDLENTNINMEASQYYLYAPQKTNLPLAKDTTANTVKLSVLAESSTNNYQWIKDENLLSTQTDSTISYEVTDTGTYYCKITNDNFPDLTLQSIAIGKNMKNGVVRDDYDALVSIYTHTNGENWNNKDNWLTPEHVSNWHGVTVKGSRVVRLILSTNNLSGTIPTELAQLDSLNTLSIWDNKGITGSIPSELSKLKKLEYLRISNEKLTGTVPCELASLPRLKYLYLFENKLTGCIPSEFGDMTNMTTLYICYNQFEDLPDLSGLTNLRTCIIHDNKFNFMDLEEAKIDWSSLNNWAYWPQAKLPMPDTSLVKDQLTLEVIDHANDNNFFWYKDGSLIDSSSTPQITITVGPEGYYHCKITNDNYPHLTLETDSIKIIVAFNSVNFNVSDGSEPLPDAIISINQNDLTTDNEGMASIDLVNGTYNYNISLEGYQDTSGTFTLSNSDTTINIDLSVIASFTNNPVESNVRIYPNPTGDYIFVESDVEIQRIKVVNLKGQTIFSTKPEAKKWSLNTYQIKCNIGFIHILLKNGDYVTKKIIKP